MCISQSVDALLPQFKGVSVESVKADRDSVTFCVRATANEAECPQCGTHSSRVHARYLHRLADLPLGGRRARIIVRGRRFRCVDPGCRQATFCEQIPGLTTPFAHRIPALTAVLAKIALALAGRSGSRLAAALAMPCCRDVMGAEYSIHAVESAFQLDSTGWHEVLRFRRVADLARR